MGNNNCIMKDKYEVYTTIGNSDVTKEERIKIKIKIIFIRIMSS